MLALVLGGLLGLEREWRRKPAGLRTHMMVALGAATFTLVTLRLYAHLDGTRADPSRVVEAVVTGLGFLGAGSIIQSRGSVEGLTTAGSLWLAGGVGLAAGFGDLWVALCAVGFGLVVLYALGRLEGAQEGKGSSAGDAPRSEEPPDGRRHGATGF